MPNHCYHPITVPSIKDAQGHFSNIQVPCGKCPACKENRRNEWTGRIELEAKYSKYPSWFLTLTYDDTSVTRCEYGLTLDKTELQKFMKRLRKNYKGDSKIRFFGCGEYGPNNSERPHFHVIVFNVDVSSKKDMQLLTEKCWKNGFVTVAPVTPGRAHYVAKYVNKDEDEYPDWMQPPFCFDVATPWHRLLPPKR